MNTIIEEGRPVVLPYHILLTLTIYTQCTHVLDFWLTTKSLYSSLSVIVSFRLKPYAALVII